MAFCDLHWFSSTLRKQVATYVILPDEGKPPYATFYLLHGLSDDHTIWLRRTRIESYVQNLPLIVVMPDGFRGFYTNNADGPAYADYIARDLVGMIDRTFPTRKTRSGRAIGGLSMGGYGALRLGLGFPELFASVNSHSGALGYGHSMGSAAKSALPPSGFKAVFGNPLRGSDHDLHRLARRCRDRGVLPKIRIDCGTEDHLIEQNRRYHQALAKLKIAHEYEEFDGQHNWDYWDMHIRSALQFHARNLRLKATS